MYFWLRPVRRWPADASQTDSCTGWAQRAAGAPQYSNGGRGWAASMALATRGHGAAGSPGARDAPPPAPAGARSGARRSSGMDAHLPRMNIPACHSRARNGLPPLAAIAVPSKRHSRPTCSGSLARGCTEGCASRCPQDWVWGREASAWGMGRERGCRF